MRRYLIPALLIGAAFAAETALAQSNPLPNRTGPVPTAPTGPAPAPSGGAVTETSVVYRFADAGDLIPLMQEAGLTGVEQRTTSKGQPFLLAKLPSGVNIDIYFYSCNDQGRECFSHSLTACWTMNPVATFDELNNANKTYIWGHLYNADNGDMCLVETFSSQGSTRKAIVDNFKVFDDRVGTVRKDFKF